MIQTRIIVLRLTRKSIIKWVAKNNTIKTNGMAKSRGQPTTPTKTECGNQQTDELYNEHSHQIFMRMYILYVCAIRNLKKCILFLVEQQQREAKVYV